MYYLLRPACVSTRDPSSGSIPTNWPATEASLYELGCPPPQPAAAAPDSDHFRPLQPRIGELRLMRRLLWAAAASVKLTWGACQCPAGIGRDTRSAGYSQFWICSKLDLR